MSDQAMMPMMPVTQQVQKNSSDILTLVESVSRVTALVEAQEKQRASDYDMIKEMAKGIAGLDQKMAVALGMEKEIGAVREMVLEIKSDITTSLAKVEVDVTNLKSWQDKKDGAINLGLYLARAGWAVGGMGILSVGYCALKMYFAAQGNISVGP